MLFIVFHCKGLILGWVHIGFTHFLTLIGLCVIIAQQPLPLVVTDLSLTINDNSSPLKGYKHHDRDLTFILLNFSKTS